VRLVLPTLFRCSMLIVTILTISLTLTKEEQLCEFCANGRFILEGLMSISGIGIYVFPYFVMVWVMRPLPVGVDGSMVGRE
jgi:hypothetical protein